MNLGATIRQSWFLLLVVSLLMLFLAGGLFRSLYMVNSNLDSTSVSQSASKSDGVYRPHGTRNQEDLRSILERDPGPQRPDRREQLLETIASHQAAFDADPDAPDAPNYLRAMGNLQMQRLQDFEAAALNFEQIILNYPEWRQDRFLYADLITCYEMLGDTAGLIRVAELMLERFPENSEAYLFALNKLGLWDGEFPEMVEEETDADNADESPPINPETSPQGAIPEPTG